MADGFFSSLFQGTSAAAPAVKKETLPQANPATMGLGSLLFGGNPPSAPATTSTASLPSEGSVNVTNALLSQLESQLQSLSVELARERERSITTEVKLKEIQSMQSVLQDSLARFDRDHLRVESLEKRLNEFQQGILDLMQEFALAKTKSESKFAQAQDVHLLREQILSFRNEMIKETDVVVSTIKTQNQQIQQEQEKLRHQWFSSVEPMAARLEGFLKIEDDLRRRLEQLEHMDALLRKRFDQSEFMDASLHGEIQQLLSNHETIRGAMETFKREWESQKNQMRMLEAIVHDYSQKLRDNVNQVGKDILVKVNGWQEELEKRIANQVNRKIDDAIKFLSRL